MNPNANRCLTISEVRATGFFSADEIARLEWFKSEFDNNVYSDNTDDQSPGLVVAFVRFGLWHSLISHKA